MFRQLSDNVWASQQISLDDVATAARDGFRLIINNRPEGESDDQTPGDAIATAAKAAGLGYIAIPITHAGFSQPQVTAMIKALGDGTGRILAYCRSGTRSTLLWALAQASEGADLDLITSQAAAAGYDVTPVRPLMDMLAAQPR